MNNPPCQLLCLCFHLSEILRDSDFRITEGFLSWRSGGWKQRSVRIGFQVQLLGFLAFDAFGPGPHRGLAEVLAVDVVASTSVAVTPAVDRCFRSVATRVPGGGFFAHLERCWLWMLLVSNCVLWLVAVTVAWYCYFIGWNAVNDETQVVIWDGIWNEIRKSWGIISVRKKYCSHPVLGYCFDSFVFKETGIQDLQSESDYCSCSLLPFVISVP